MAYLGNEDRPTGARCDYCERELHAILRDEGCIGSPALVAASRAGWEWATGAEEETRHICAKCLRKRAGEWQRWLETRFSPQPSAPSD